MSNHLTLSDRIVIERGLNNDFTFATIARMLDRSPSSISREVRRYRIVVKSNRSFNGNDCTKRAHCLRNTICDDAPFHGCSHSRCKYCPDVLCIDICPAYESPDCKKLEKPPYVCVGCPNQKKCNKNHAYYSAHRADKAHVFNEYQNQGIASEILAGLVSETRRLFKDVRIFVRVDKENMASRRVAEKCGGMLVRTDDAQTIGAIIALVKRHTGTMNASDEMNSTIEKLKESVCIYEMP